MKRTIIPIGITPSLRGVDALLTEVGDFLQPLVTLVMREYWVGVRRLNMMTIRQSCGWAAPVNRIAEG